MTKELLHPGLGSGALREALHAIGLRLEGKAFPMTPHDMAEPCITLADYQTEVQGLLAALSLSSPIEPGAHVSEMWQSHARQYGVLSLPESRVPQGVDSDWIVPPHAMARDSLAWDPAGILRDTRGAVRQANHQQALSFASRP